MLHLFGTPPNFAMEFCINDRLIVHLLEVILEDINSKYLQGANKELEGGVSYLDGFTNAGSRREILSFVEAVVGLFNNPPQLRKSSNAKLDNSALKNAVQELLKDIDLFALLPHISSLVDSHVDAFISFQDQSNSLYSSSLLLVKFYPEYMDKLRSCTHHCVRAFYLNLLRHYSRGIVNLGRNEHTPLTIRHDSSFPSLSELAERFIVCPLELLTSSTTAASSDDIDFDNSTEYKNPQPPSQRPSGDIEQHTSKHHLKNIKSASSPKVESIPCADTLQQELQKVNLGS
eukprot:GILJ01007211.1.p1 GENE.GILJ01007211.1~~GILJ01007211.1.p1  ORF type:complete len:288 (-),score=40.92 GILJ01007211.1:148-1011(-)